MSTREKTDILTELLAAADKRVLVELLSELAADDADIRRECVAFLKEEVTLTAKDSGSAVDAVAIMSLWDEIEPDLSELDEYGGGDYAVEDHVSELLHELCSKVGAADIDREGRRELLDEILPFIHTGNAGMDDALYDVAYAACKDDQDLRRLAEEFERMGERWPRDHARRIYRRLGDREKYLELRTEQMVYGLDFYDLATFHWENGETDKALAVALDGLEKATGRMEELRDFVAERDGRR